MVNNTLSLRARLAGTMAVLFVGGMVVLYLAARAYAQTAADHSYDRLLAGSALSIAETLSIASGELKVDLPYAALDMLSAAPDDRVFYRVSGPDGTTVTGYDDLPRISNAGNPRSKPGQNPPQPRFFSASYRGVLIRFVVLGRQISEPGVSGWIWVQVGQTRAARETLADELVLRALIPIGFMTMLALGLVWFGIGRALQPLRRVGEDLAAREPAARRRHQRIHAPPVGEHRHTPGIHCRSRSPNENTARGSQCPGTNGAGR
jgi:two-component system sensor histidine kinase TctE